MARSYSGQSITQSQHQHSMRQKQDVHANKGQGGVPTATVAATAWQGFLQNASCIPCLYFEVFLLRRLLISWNTAQYMEASTQLRHISSWFSWSFPFRKSLVWPSTNVTGDSFFVLFWNDVVNCWPCFASAVKGEPCVTGRDSGINLCRLARNPSAYSALTSSPSSFSLTSIRAGSFTATIRSAVGGLPGKITRPLRALDAGWKGFYYWKLTSWQTQSTEEWW